MGFIVMGIISLVSWAYSAYQTRKAARAEERSGVLQQEAAEASGELFDWNARISDLQALDAEARGAEEERRFRESVRGLVGRQRATQAANNLDVSFGSAVDVQADAATLGELDALTIRTNARREAWGHRVESEDLRQRGRLVRKEGVNMGLAARERSSGMRAQAVGSFLTTGASLAQARYGMGRW
jgi:hypothetical protein